MTPLPPKQGLKRRFGISETVEAEGYDTTSTKTRIETITFTKIFSYNACYDTTSTKTRIETSCMRLPAILSGEL